MSMQGWLSGSQSEARWLAQLERIEWKENEILLLWQLPLRMAALPAVWQWARDKGVAQEAGIFVSCAHSRRAG